MIFRKYSLLMLFLFLLIHNDVSSQTEMTPGELEQKVDAMFPSQTDKPEPGMSIAIVKDGKVLLEKGYGMANLEYQIPNNPATVFDLASVSKQFTGYAISTLVEDGKINLDDDIRKYIPELANFGSAITIDHLVHHTSGIRDWTSTLPLAGWTFDDVITFDQILRMAYHQTTLNFEPGSQYVYSNTGYNLLAELVHRVTGQTLAEWTQEHIFKPLDMKQTLFLEDYTEVIPHSAISYYLKDGTFHKSVNNLTAVGSSSLFASVTDLTKWAIHLDQPGEEKQNVVERMFTKGVLNNGEENSYAFGLDVRDVNGIRQISHGGSWASFRTYLLYLPKYHLSVIVLNNEPNNSYQMANNIAALFLPKESGGDELAQEVDDETPVQIDNEVLDRYVGTYRLGPGWYVEISRKDDQLWTQATNELAYPMTCQSDSVFIVPGYGGRTMTFLSNQEGKVVEVQYNNSNHPRVADEDPPGPKQLQDYVGEYVCDELNTTYTVVVENDTLKMKHFRHGIIDLSHAWKDDFRGSQWYLNSVDFQRNATGKVTGFKVWQYRARDQEFVRVE